MMPPIGNSRSLLGIVARVAIAANRIRCHHCATASTLVAIFAVASTVGCEFPKRPDLSDTSRSRTKESTEPLEFEPPDFEVAVGWVDRFIYYRDRKPVGYNVMRARSASVSDTQPMIDVPASAMVTLNTGVSAVEDLWYEVEDSIEFERGEATFQQVLRQVSRQTRLGELIGFWSRLEVGPSATESLGMVEGDQIQLEVMRGQKRLTRTIPWDLQSRGLLAVAESLRNEPIEPGKTRLIRQLLPVKNQIASVQLDAVSQTAVPWTEGPPRILMEVAQQIAIDGELVSESILWVDEEGEIQRTFTPSLNMIAYRCDQEALNSLLDKRPDLRVEADPEQVEYAYNASVEVGGKAIPDSSKTRRVAFVVQPLGEDVADETQELAIPAAPDQHIGQYKQNVLVLVTRNAEAKINPNFQRFEEEATASDRRPTSLLDYRAKSVRDISRSSIQGASLTPIQIADELNGVTHSLIERTEFMGRFERASNIAVANRGGAAQFAVLHAAMLRERGIPARIAVGLVYVPADPVTGDQARLALSAWTVAFVDSKWVSFDPVRGTRAAADRIILQLSDTTQGIDQATFLKVFRQMEQMKIRVFGFKA